MEPEQLQDLIAEAQAGSGQAYEMLLEAYWPRLYGYFLRATGNASDAEDLLGETGLRLVRTLPKYRHCGRFEPWLFRIAANLVRDRFRRRKVRGPAVSLSSRDGEGGRPWDRLAALDGPVGQELETAEAVQKLNAALQRLDDTTRQMILLRHYGEMSFREIAETCACPIGTVLARVHRGLKTLRSRLSTKHETR